MSNITGANKTPLGKFNPTFGTSSFSSAGNSGASSLLKPNYMTGGDGPAESAPYQSQVHVEEYPIATAARGIKRDYEYDNNSNDSNSRPMYQPPVPPPLSISRDTARKDNAEESREERRKKRKSRWGGTEQDKVVIPGMPTILPPNMSADQERIYLLQLQIEEVSRRLRTGDLGIPMNPEERSPSPEPIYNNEGKRLNTREFRTRKKLEDDRHSLIQQMIQINPAYKPPGDYKAPQTKISEKVLIPQEEYPDINFVGLLIGPRGNTLKSMERDTNAKIIIRGKGSVKEGKIGRKDGQPIPGEDEPLHAFVTGSTQDSVTRAVAKIKEVIRQGIEVPENQNDLRRNQLRELALLNGTLRESDGPRCSNCGSTAHRTWQCPDKQNVTNNITCLSCGGTGHVARDCKERKQSSTLGSAASSKIDEEYLSLMAELGQAPPPNSGNSSSNDRNSTSYSSNNASSSYSSMTSQPPRAIAAPPPPSTHGLLPTPAGSTGTSTTAWASTGNGTQQTSAANYWQQQQTAALYGASAAAYDPVAYAQLYSQQNSAANWMQAWTQAGGQTTDTTTPTSQTATAAASNPWAQYMAGIAVPPPPPPPPV